MMEAAFPITWDQKINLIGKKIENPRLHLCEKCNFPILIYGRMIPCKHVFCFDCAKTTEKTCLRCGDSVSRVEQSLQGQIFMCEYGAPKHSHSGCRRTYLSQRDLQAHVNHRHKKQGQKSHDHSKSSKDRRPSDPRTEPRGERAEPKRERSESRPDPRLETRTSTYQQVQNYSVGSSVAVEAPSADYGLTQPIIGQATGTQGDYHMEHVPVRNTNLITVPLHDSGGGGEYQAPVQYANTSAPPPPPPPVQAPYAAPVMVPPEHQTGHTVRPQIPYQVPHVAPIMTPQPGGYTSATASIPPPPPAVPQAVPYNMAPQAVPPNPVVHYEQPPQSSSYVAQPNGGHSGTTFSAPVSAAWTTPTQSHSVPGAIPAPEGTAASQPHPTLPDSTTYPGSYY
ncbi:uncharacterized protein [Apostichopus japonicus]|uniref:uncharacterized protein n=1 Tax=Stichopus japonicus TaxID=307972 RepID=UPI003AB5C8C5